MFRQTDFNTLQICDTGHPRPLGVIVRPSACSELFGGVPHASMAYPLGGPLPDWPASLVTLTNDRYEDVAYSGYHLAWTCMAGRFYEWSPYVPDHTPPSGGLGSGRPAGSSLDLRPQAPTWDDFVWPVGACR